MRARLISGIVGCLLGAVWFLQGINVLGGSGMSGEAFWAVAGAVLVALGAIQLLGVRRTRRESRS